MRHLTTKKTRGFAPIAGSALLLASLIGAPAQVVAQQDDVVIDPVDAPAGTTTPTLMETTSLVAGIFGDINRQMQDTLDDDAECKAAGVIDAGRPNGDLQERTCQVRFYGALQDTYQASAAGLTDAGQQMFVQRELLQKDKDALRQTIVMLEGDRTEAETGMAVVAEEMRAFLEEMGGIPGEDDRDARLRFRTLDEAYSRGEIRVAQLTREIHAKTRLMAGIEQQQEMLAAFGYGFLELAEKQKTAAMEAGYRLGAAKDDLEWERAGAGGMQEGMADMADTLNVLLDTLGRGTLPPVAPIDPARPQENLPEIGPDISAGAAERWSTILGEDVQDMATSRQNAEVIQ